jgi:carboxymethylenebutenolidase
MDDLQGLTKFPLARRGFFMTSLISGLTLATTRVEAQAIHTDSTGLEAGEFMLPVSGGSLPGYYARPAGAGPFPIVVVNEEIFGVHEYLKDTCRRFAKAGYMAVVVEVYARLGDISEMTDAASIVRDFVAKSPDATLMADTDALVAWAAANKGDANRIGVTGFCRGGRTTWLYAIHNPKVKAAVAWYGQVVTPATEIQPKSVLDLAGSLKVPMLGLYGGKDGSIKIDDVNAAAAKAKAAGTEVEIVVYPDAGHAFHADYRPSYNATDAADGFKRCLAWFKAHGV